MADCRKLLIDSGAIVEGHFVYASGNHSGLYVNKTAGLVPASHAGQFAWEMALPFFSERIEAVVAPELGAILLMAHIAANLHFQSREEVMQVIAEKVRDENGKHTGAFKIGRDQVRFVVGKRTLLVEDIATTGGSVKDAVRAAREVGAEIVAVAILWNRGGVTAEGLGVPELFSLINEPLEMFPLEKCPFCKGGIPINTDLGKGKEFFAKKKANA